MEIKKEDYEASAATKNDTSAGKMRKMAVAKRKRQRRAVKLKRGISGESGGPSEEGSCATRPRNSRGDPDRHPSQVRHHMQSY